MKGPGSMNLAGKHLERVARKLGYMTKLGRKHIIVYSEEKLITTLPRGRIKPGTLAAILKQMGITKRQLGKML